MKIHIIGCSGSGKTYLANALSKKYNISHFDLDDKWAMLDRRTNSSYGSRRRRSQTSAGRDTRRQSDTRYRSNTHRRTRQSARGNRNSIIDAISDVLSGLNNAPAYVIMDVIFGVVVISLVIIAFNFDSVIYGLYAGFLFPVIQVLSGLFGFIIVFGGIALIIYYKFFRRR